MEREITADHQQIAARGIPTEVTALYPALYGALGEIADRLHVRSTFEWVSADRVFPRGTATDRDLLESALDMLFNGQALRPADAPEEIV